MGLRSIIFFASYFYTVPKAYGYQTLMNLPRHLFFVSTPFMGNREYQVLETIDPKAGPSKELCKNNLRLFSWGDHIVPFAMQPYF